MNLREYIKKIRTKRIVFKVIIPSQVVLILVFLILFSLIYFYSKKTSSENAEEILLAEALKTSEQVSNYFKTPLNITSAIAKSLLAYRDFSPSPQREFVFEVLDDVMNEEKDFYAVWSMWESNAFDGRDLNYARQYNQKDGRYNVALYRKGDSVYKQDHNAGTNNPEAYVSDGNLIDYEGGFYLLPKYKKSQVITEPYYYSFTKDTANNVLMTSIVSPIIKDSVFLGVVGVDMDLLKIEEIISELSIHQSENIKIISGEGFIISDSEKKQSHTTIDLSEIDPDGGTQIQKVFSDYKNTYVFRVIVPIDMGNKDNSWYIFNEVFVSAVYADTQRLLNIISISFLLGFVFISIVLIVISNNLSKPILKLVEYAKIISTGNFSYKIGLKRDDEIGVLVRTLENMSLELKNRSEALLASEEKFRSVYEFSRDAIIVSNETGFIECNEAALKLFGYNNKEEIFLNDTVDLSPINQPDGSSSKEKADRIMSSALQGKGEIFEWIYKKKDGPEFPTEILLSPMVWNGEQVVIAVIRDITDRKKEEESRFESLARFSGFAKASQYGMGMADFNGKIIYVNSTLKEMLGEKSEEDCIGKHFPTSYYCSPSTEKLQNEVMPALLSKGNWHGELELLTVDGRKVPTDENYFVIKDENGAPKYLADILTDITERKKAEKALWDSERKLHAIFDHHYQLTGLIDSKGRLIAANKTALKLTGTLESKIVGEYFWDGPWWDESQKQNVIKAFNKAMKGEFVRFETTHKTYKGEIRNIDFSFNPVKDENDKVIFVVPEGRDITEIRKTEDALLENEARLRSLSDHLPGGMTYQVDTGIEGEIRKFTYVSAGVQEIHEISVEAVLKDANVLYKQIFEEDLKKVAELESKAMSSMIPFVAEARFKLPSGKIRWHLLTSAPRRIPNGHLIWDGIELDITDRKQTELELEKYRNHLEKMVAQRTNELKAALDDLREMQAQLVQSEKMASLGILTAGVAHEINNPLNFILGSYTGLEKYFSEKGIEDENILVLLNSLKAGVERTASIVKGLNQFSRDKSNLDEDCHIHSIINNCLLMLNNLIGTRIEVKKKYSPIPVQCSGNVGKLHQVFINILTNAIHAIESEGSISITTQLKKNSVLIEISDTGCGINKNDMKKILDPFYTTKDPGKGTGLGLSIVYNIIEEHKGEIEFQSKVNKGTLVMVKLPI